MHRIGRYFEREATIIHQCRGKRVLHLGCVGETEMPDDVRVRAAPNLLHHALSEVADVVGIDTSKSVIDAYRRLGIFENIVVGDVQELERAPVDNQFDVVVAGDIIEHLSRPGDLLDGIHRFCSSSTQVIITTPHSFGLPNFVRHALGRFQDGNDHVMTFNSDNLVNLLSRHGYATASVDTCHQKFARGGGLGFMLGRALFRSIPRLGGTLYVVARSTMPEHRT